MLINLSPTQGSLSFRLTLACIFFHIIFAQGLKLVSLSHHLPSQNIAYDSSNYVSPGLVYGTYVKNSSHKNYEDWTFVMETNSNVGSSNHLRFCNFTRRAYVESKSLENYFIVAIDESTAAITRNYGYYHPQELLILHFSDCRVTHVDVEEERFFDVQAPSNDIFDVVSIGFRTIVDFDGNIVTGKRPDWIPYGNGRRFVVQSPLKGRFVVTDGLRFEPHDVHRVIQVYTVEDDGTPEIVREYRFDDIDYFKREVSSTHQLLSVCATSNLTVFCGQFDLNGRLKFETSLLIMESWQGHFIKTYNLREGGLLLLVYKCFHRGIHEPCIKQDDDYFIVKRIDKTGRPAGTLKISQFPDMSWNDIHKRMHFFENENNEMCLSTVFNKDYHENDDQVTLSVVCFKDEEFFP